MSGMEIGPAQPPRQSPLWDGSRKLFTSQRTSLAHLLRGRKVEAQAQSRAQRVGTRWAPNGRFGVRGNGGLPICNELAAMWKAEIVRRLTQCALLWRCVPTPCGSADWTMYREPRHGSRRFGVFPGSHSRKTLMGNGAPLMTLSRRPGLVRQKCCPWLGHMGAFAWFGGR
jgi:hypothetical protein